MAPQSFSQSPSGKCSLVSRESSVLEAMTNDNRGRSILLAESQSSRKHKLFIQRCVDPRPEQKPRTEQLEYFLVNQGLPNVSLHGHPLDLYTVAGPLPPFSVIEAGTKVIFWWRDELALTYDPSKAGKKAGGS